MGRIFITHAFRDIEIAEKILHQLNKRGYITFDSTSGIPSSADSADVYDTFYETITLNIQECDNFVFLISESSLNSQWCRREVEYANRIGKPIIPLVIDGPAIIGYLQNSWAHFIFTNPQWFIVDTHYPDSAVEYIVESYRKSVSRFTPRNVSTPSKSELNTTSEFIEGRPRKWYTQKRCWIVMSALVLLLLTIWIFGLSNETIKTIDSAPDTPEANPVLYDYGHLPYNFYIFCGALLALTISLASYYYLNCRKIRIKMVANEDCDVIIDNNAVATIQKNTVSFLKVKKGIYFVLFVPKDKSFKEKSLSYKVRKYDDLIKVELEKDQKMVERIKIRCFIAGSTKLRAERDALRAVIAQVDNRFSEKNVDISSHTYEDFERAVVDGGHQRLYDEFITHEATIAVFIISGEIGEYTITEFKKALDAFKSGKHPQILVFNDTQAKTHTQAQELKKIVSSENQYWADYISLEDLKHQFLGTLIWLIIERFPRQFK